MNFKSKFKSSSQCANETDTIFAGWLCPSLKKSSVVEGLFVSKDR